MKKPALTLAALSVVLSLLLPLAGCDSAPDNSEAGKTVVFIPKITGNAFFESANTGAQAYAERNGFSVEYVGNAEADVSHQLDIIAGAIEDKADAICISSLDKTALDSELKRARKAGIAVVTWDSDVSGDARSLMVSQGTPDQLGRMLVEMGAKSLLSRGLDPTADEICYVWHYSQASVADQNSWFVAGEKYIAETYPNWVNASGESYYSNQNSALAVETGGRILDEHPDIDLIICNDSTALPGQAEALKQRGLTAEDVTVTGFASPNSMRSYCEDGIVERWGLWDCQVQGSIGCYLASWLSAGNTAKVGDRIAVPEIGTLEVMPNTVLDPDAYTASDSGVVLLPSRTEFTAENVGDFDF